MYDTYSRQIFNWLSDSNLLEINDSLEMIFYVLFLWFLCWLAFTWLRRGDK